MTKYNCFDILSKSDFLSYQKKIKKFVEIDDPTGSTLLNFTKYINTNFYTLLSFILITYRNKILGFASVAQISHWPKGIVRIYNRFYLCKNLRVQGAGGYNNIRKEVGHLLYNTMFQKCRDHNMKIAVVTRENTGHLNAIRAVHREVNSHDFHKKWKIYPDYILTCNQPKKQKCWQRAIFRFIDEMEEDCTLMKNIPSLFQRQYKKKFLNKKYSTVSQQDSRNKK